MPMMQNSLHMHLDEAVDIQPEYILVSATNKCEKVVLNDKLLRSLLVDL